MARRAKSAETAADDGPKKDDDVILYWLAEIDAAKKREKDFRKDGDRINEIYDGRRADTTPFNILFSNTETIAPVLYSMTPRPVVKRRFATDDPLGLASAKAGQRMLEFLLDTNIDGYDTFSDAMNAAVLSGVLPGRGVTSVKYDFEEGELAPPTAAAPPEEGATDVPATTPYKKSELVCCDSREWNRVYHGYARKWSKVPWVAYEEHIDNDEAERLFGKEIAAAIEYTIDEDYEEEGEKRSDDDERNKGERKTALVYKIWDKRGGKKVRFVSPQMKSGFLKVMDDPLGMTGFFDCPRPLTFVAKVNDLLPVALYILYENQAVELNRLTIRINKIVNAIKARGAYDGSLGTVLEKIMDEDDNALVATDDAMGEKSLKDSIWFMPLAELIATLEKLYQAREACKTVIYEIIGIADIMRGSSKASETLGAQQIKNQWGTLRVKPKQAEVQRYARDLLRMMLEVAASKFSEDTWAKMTGLPFSTSQQIEQAKALMMAAQMQGQMQPPPPAMPGQPPQPPQMPPEVQKAMQVLQAPAWPAILKMLQDDLQRSYRIDIETNSTIEPEAAEDQKNIAELMATLGQFLNGMGGLVEKGIMPFEVAQTMMLAITRRYRFGDEIEDQIKAMKPPPPQDDGAAQKAQEQAQQMQAELQKAQAGQMAAEQKLESKETEIKLMQKAIDLANRERDLETEKKLFEIEKQSKEAQIQTRDKVGQESLANKEKVSQIKDAAANREQQHAQKAKKDVEGSTKQLAETSGQVKQLTEMFNKVLEQQGNQTQELVKAFTAVMSAPRKRTLERDPATGRATGMREEIEGPQTVN